MAPEFGKPIHQLPLIPANVLKKHHVHEPLDTRFRSGACLLQSIWREERGLPIGSYVSEDGKRRKLGSHISEAAGRGGGNFLTPEIAHIARVRLPLPGDRRASVNSSVPWSVPTDPAYMAYASLAYYYAVMSLYLLA